MSDGDQSEDGQVMSGVELSPSDDEETNDSLDIKPPQASYAYYGGSKRKEKKPKERSKYSKEQQMRHHMMEREARDRDRGGGNRGEREHYRERDHHSGGSREQHRSSQSSRVGASGLGSSGRERMRESNREKHHSTRYELNPFYGEMRETYHSKRDREREREHRERDRERDYERVREYPEKRERRTEVLNAMSSGDSKADPEKMLEDLRTRLLNKKNRYDSRQQQRDVRERERDMLPDSELYTDEMEYYREKRERKREHQHRHHREEEMGKEGRDRGRNREHRERERDRYETRGTGSDVVEIVESPDRYDTGVPRTAEEREHEARRAKLLEADREMLRRKELAREELEARRLRKEEERNESDLETDSGSDDDDDDNDEEDDADAGADMGEEGEEEDEQGEVVVLSGDEQRERRPRKRTRQRRQRRQHHTNRGDISRGVSESESSSSRASEDESEGRSNGEEDEEPPPVSPLSVGELAKSDRRDRRDSHSASGSESDSRSRSRSPHHRHEESRSDSSRSREDLRARSNRDDGDQDNDRGKKPDGSKSPKPSATADGTAAGEEEPEVEVKNTLPPYFPGIQGCRSVEEFLCLNRIEEGTYGVVYRAKDKRTEEIVALKRLKMEKEKEGFPITSLREINTLLKGQHPNIVTVREIVVGSNMDKIFIVMDYVEHDLKSLMETMKHKKQVFLPGEVKCLTQQLLRAVAHLHDNWILHRDLKTSNLLLSHKGILKVGDFGLAREYGSPLKAYTSIVVTLWYRAPELLLCCKEYSTPIDIWSVGCIFAEFLSMAALFPGKTEIDQLNRIFKDLGTPNEKIWPGYNQLPAVQKMTFTEYPVSNLRKKFSHLTSELGIGLLQGLLTFDSKQRLTAEVALQHTYFRELPLPIDPAMFPTWPAKSELGLKKALASSPKPPSGGGEFKKLGDDPVPDNAIGGFHLGGATYAESRQLAMGPGFSLKF
ncbi:cyclin-dependent kinase 11B [Anopheles bellator]|uniref:cyclin-dependent kinase 11B n=1 Tax=Anopheles bellator TaxID=139047 RepID=UPI00264998AC|nr:cyclin-dependent kinase 11B [Anopheles bellator]